MSLMKFSIPLTLYRLEPSTLANVTGDAIRRFAFRSIDNTPDEKGYGFVASMTFMRPCSPSKSWTGRLRAIFRSS